MKRNLFVSSDCRFTPCSGMGHWIQWGTGVHCAPRETALILDVTKDIGYAQADTTYSIGITSLPE
jgi:hypothetical protein